jgi:hypothetical protein
MKMNEWKKFALGVGLIVALLVGGLAVKAAAHDSADPWQPVRVCETGEPGTNYGTATGNGYYGAYQFDQTTWADVVVRAGFPEWSSQTANHAPPHVQDAAAEQLRLERGLQPWPNCGRLYGSEGQEKPLPERTGTYGRAGDERHECNVDGHGDVRVVRRGNRLLIDSDNNGGTHDRPHVGFGRASDAFMCADLDGDGDDEMIVHREGVGSWWGDVWATGVGRPL